MVVCHADFSKAALDLGPGVPLGACADAFLAGSAIDAWLAGKLKPLARAASLTIVRFRTANRLVTDGIGDLVWVRMEGVRFANEGLIGPPRADAPETECPGRTPSRHRPTAFYLAGAA
jgi:arsenite methyltransferase